MEAHLKEARIIFGVLLFVFGGGCLSPLEGCLTPSSTEFRWASPHPSSALVHSCIRITSIGVLAAEEVYCGSVEDRIYYQGGRAAVVDCGRLWEMPRWTPRATKVAASCSSPRGGCRTLSSGLGRGRDHISDHLLRQGVGQTVSEAPW
jgi:hypothetical protein